MNAIRISLATLALLGFLLLDDSESTAQVKGLKKRFFQRPGTAQGAPGAKMDQANDLLTAPLIPADAVARMKLTAEQKPQVDKLFQEFNTKLKALSGAGATTPAAKTPPGKGDKGNFKKGGGTDGPGAKALLLRDEYEDRLEELLTEAQKKVLDDMRAKAAESLLNPGVKGTTPAPKK